MDYAGLRAVVVRRLRSLGAGQGDAEDCAQEALLALWSALSAGNRPDNLVAWTTQVARRRYADIVRREIRRHDRPLVTEEHDRTMPTPEQRAVERGHAHWLAGRLTALPAVTQTVCEMAHDGHGRAGIAARLGISLSSADSHLTRARRYLRGQAALAWAAISAAGWCLARKQTASAAALAAVAVTVAVVVPSMEDAPDAERSPVIDDSTGGLVVNRSEPAVEAVRQVKTHAAQRFRPVVARRETVIGTVSGAGGEVPAVSKPVTSTPVVPRVELKLISPPSVVRQDVADVVVGLRGTVSSGSGTANPGFGEHD